MLFSQTDALCTRKFRGSCSCLKQAGNNVVRVNTIYQPSSVVMNKPARNIDTVLRIFSVILLPAPARESTVTGGATEAGAVL